MIDPEALSRTRLSELKEMVRHGNGVAVVDMAEMRALIGMVESAEEAADEWWEEASHYLKVACDDPGKNPPVFWVDRAKELEDLCREALRDLTWVYDTYGLEAGAGGARGTINRLSAAMTPPASGKGRDGEGV